MIAHGGDVQQIVAEAFVQEGKAYFNADISIQNGGGVRADLSRGKITIQDVYTVLPFKNSLIQLNATGAEITAALEDALEGVVGPAANTGCYPYAGGLRWQVDLNRAKGSRLSHLEVKFDRHAIRRVGRVARSRRRSSASGPHLAPLAGRPDHAALFGCQLHLFACGCGPHGPGPRSAA